MLGPDRILAAAHYDFTNKRFLVTGASGGIGLAAIKKLLEGEDLFIPIQGENYLTLINI